MLSFLKNLFWAPREQQTETEALHSLPEVGRKRRPSASEPPIDIKRSRGLVTASQISWNLDLEQADYRFSREAITIFKGGGPTVLISRQCKQKAFSLGHRSGQSVFGAAATAVQHHDLLFGSRPVCESPSNLNLSQATLSVLRGLENLPTFRRTALVSAPTPLKPPPPPPPPPQQSTVPAASKFCVHSTPLVMSAAPGKSGKSSSTVPKSATAVPGQSQSKAQATPAADDDDCVITSVEGPKSVAEMFSPCKYMSPNWLVDIKTSSQSLKSYMQKAETEETLKMQYWAKRRELDERDLVARVTRNLKLSERELPVLPYKYEEPPPTPPPSPPPPPPPPPPLDSEPDFPELSEAQSRSVERAWSRQLPGAEVLAEGFSLRVTREELRSLCGLNWLNDNIVNFYMQLLVARVGPGLPRVHAFSTFFYTKLSSGGYASVRRWTRKVDIFDRDVLLCPVHLHNNHWTLCIVDLRSRYILHLDSLSHGGSSGDLSCLPLMRQYLAEEHRDKKGSELDVGEFQLVREIGAPQQANGSDCGVFCCKFADYYCKGREFTFGQTNMPYFRKRTTVEILEKRLLW